MGNNTDDEKRKSSSEVRELWQSPRKGAAKLPLGLEPRLMRIEERLSGMEEDRHTHLRFLGL